MCIYIFLHASLKYSLRRIPLPTKLFGFKIALAYPLACEKLHILLKQRHFPLFNQPTAHKILKKERHFKHLEL